MSDTISQSQAGMTNCFTITPKANVSIGPAATAQVFKAWIRVVPDPSVAAGVDRQVIFLVPPAIE